LVLNPLVAANAPYDPIQDFEPVSIIGSSIGAFLVNSSLPVRTLAELVSYAKGQNIPLSYGSAGVGTTTHLSFELFKQVAGISNFTHVPYRGTAPGISDLLGGHITAMSTTVSAASLDLHRQGKARMLVITTDRNLSYATDIPNSVAAGYPTLISQLMIGLFTPAKTPRPVIDKLLDATRTAMQSSAMQQKFVQAGIEPTLDSAPEAARELLGKELRRWRPVIEATGLKAN
jgi:tripartite-type tricarboxylate transporter receptor subunit TctC